LDRLYFRATASELLDQNRQAYIEAFINYANESVAQSDWFEGHCDTWMISEVWRENTQEEWHALYADPAGSMRAWTLLIHGLMTSYAYLHD